jgi:quercetin dioxygenase-like cupin family protein
VSGFLDNNPLKEGTVPIRLFAQGEHLTVNLVTPTEPLKAHYHETHEETVYLVRGRGLLRLGAETKQMNAGDLAHIPKRLIHGFTPEGKDCLAISIFGPAFDGKDRIFVGD